MIFLDLLFGFLLVFAGKNIFELSAGGVSTINYKWFVMILGVGFLGCGYLLMNIFSQSAQQDLYSWLIFVIGGILGMCLMVITFDWSLIMISSLLGASLIINAFHGKGELRELLFICSVTVGIIVQYLSCSNLKPR
jgi:hypothetical protein